MKYHLTGFGVSAVFHGGVLLLALPLLLWQEKLGKQEKTQPVILSVTQFQAAPAAPPAPEPTPIPPAIVPKPPKPIPAEKPKPKPVGKPKPRAAVVAKPQPKPAEKPNVKPEPHSETHPQLPFVAAEPAPKAAPISQPPPAAMAENRAAETAYRAKLQGLIAARKQYPSMAERMDAEGTVMVAFTVTPNGIVNAARISKSSGNEWLDKAAVQAVNAVSGVLPFPPEIHKARWDFTLAVNFQLD